MTCDPVQAASSRCPASNATGWARSRRSRRRRWRCGATAPISCSLDTCIQAMFDNRPRHEREVQGNRARRPRRQRTELLSRCKPLARLGAVSNASSPGLTQAPRSPPAAPRAAGSPTSPGPVRHDLNPGLRSPFDVPTRPQGASASRSSGHSSPVALTVNRRHRKQRHPRAGREVQPRPARRMETDVVFAHQDAAPVGLAHQRVVAGQLVIEPAAHEPRAEDQRRLDRAQRLVEIGAVLLGDLVQASPDRAGRGSAASRLSMSPTTRTGISPSASARAAAPSQATRFGASVKRSETVPALSSPPPSSVTLSKKGANRCFMCLTVFQLRNYP